MRPERPASLSVVFHLIEILEELGVLLAVDKELDRDYLSRWASTLGLAGLLKRATEEADSG